MDNNLIASCLFSGESHVRGQCKAWGKTCKRGRVTMPRSKTGAGPELNGAFFPSQKIKNIPRPGQNLVLKIKWIEE